MIVRDPEAIGGERAKILDFGIAKVQQSADVVDASAVKTRPGALMGTPRYMSPEQCRGAGEITGKSDVYSLGVMLYEMVSGRPPMVAEAMGELIAMHLMIEPPPLHELEPALPLELTQLIHAMLRKAPEQRPAIAEVVKQLEQLGAGRSIPPGVAPLSAPIVGEKSSPPSPSFPEVVAGMLATPSTLRAAQSKSPTKLASRRLLGAAAGVAAVVAVLVSVPFLRRTPPAPASLATAAMEVPTPTPGLASPRKVHWRITTQPEGARVVRSSDGVILGTTPWQSEGSGGTQPTRVRLQLAGFAEQSLELSQSADVDRSEQLQPVSPVTPSEPNKHLNRKTPSSGAKSRKSSSEDLSDDELRIVK